MSNIFVTTSGLQPSVACQLRTDNIVVMGGEHCIKGIDNEARLTSQEIALESLFLTNKGLLASHF